MRSLAEVDRDLDALGVSAARLSETRARATAARPASLVAADAELEALAAGTTPVARAAERPVSEPAPKPAAPEPAPTSSTEDGRGSGLIEVSDEVLRSTELPAVLALEGVEPEGAAALDDRAPSPEIAGALDALALDLDSGETPIEMAPEPAPSRASGSTVPPARVDDGLDDPNADLGALLGEADPLRDTGAAPSVSAGFDDELEDEHTAMFTAADAARFSRPPAPDATSGEDLELDIEEVVLDDEELLESAAVAPARPPPGRTQPPPPPRTQPPEPPKGGRPSEAPARGFLGKLLQRKP